jgi:glucosamine 6-phosphate synthetase-like amidotransferase/phosphosugar isomerase protein
MRELQIFNTVRISDPSELKANDLKDMKYGGFLTLTQSGSGKDIQEALKTAYKSNMTCFNIVNMEDSPITRVIDEL